MKGGQRQKNNDKVGASSIGYNLTMQAFGPAAAAATDDVYLDLQSQAYSLKASSQCAVSALKILYNTDLSLLNRASAHKHRIHTMCIY